MPSFIGSRAGSGAWTGTRRITGVGRVHHGSFDNTTKKRIRVELLRILDSPGSTIGEIEERLGRTYPESESQEEYRDKPVWHLRMDMDPAVLKKLWLDPKMLGKNRPTNDYNRAVIAQIIILRNSGYLEDYPRRRFNTHRLAKDAGPLIRRLKKEISREERLRLEPRKPVEPRDPDDILRDEFIRIMRYGKKSTTYKFALARAMLDYSVERGSGASPNIKYTYLASKFLKYYWNQIYRFKMRQGRGYGIPRINTIIEDVFGDNEKKRYKDLSTSKKQRAKRRILNELFGDDKDNTSIVVHRFQNGSTEKPFFKPDDHERCIRLKDGVLEFLGKNYKVLLAVVIKEWALKLETFNKTLPMLITKVEKNNDKRNSLVKYKAMFMDHMCECFYCGKSLKNVKIEVDHFIPWTYVFDDDEWNLVLSCKRCNCDKSNMLPSPEKIDALIERNKKYRNKILDLDTSLERLGSKDEWEDEIRDMHKRCGAQGFVPWI